MFLLSIFSKYSAIFCGLTLLCWQGFSSMAVAVDQIIEAVVDASPVERSQLIMTIPFDKNTTKPQSVSVSTAEGESIPAQILSTDLNNPLANFEIVLQIPKIAKNKSLALKIALGEKSKTSHSFQWKLDKSLKNDMAKWSTTPDLFYDNHLVLRYMNPTYDEKETPNKKDNFNPTFKVYHHLFANDGKTLLTNGSEGIYPHHRGIFWGFNVIKYNKIQCDIWHGRKGTHQKHDQVLLTEAGPVCGIEQLGIKWVGPDQTIIANETRELKVYHIPNGSIIDFSAKLTTELEKVHLDGDPQHAGFHFRASHWVEKMTTKETYFLRPTGKGKLNQEINWIPKTKQGPVNLSWNAMCVVIQGERYTILYLDHPENPKECRQSERCYGRIGNYFEYDLTPQKPLSVKYRLWVQKGEMTLEECQQRSEEFTKQTSVHLKK